MLCHDIEKDMPFKGRLVPEIYKLMLYPLLLFHNIFIATICAYDLCHRTFVHSCLFLIYLYMLCSVMAEQGREAIPIIYCQHKYFTVCNINNIIRNTSEAV